MNASRAEVETSSVLSPGLNNQNLKLHRIVSLYTLYLYRRDVGQTGASLLKTPRAVRDNALRDPIEIRIWYRERLNLLHDIDYRT